MIPKLTPDEYSDIVTDHNRRVRRGMVERCVSHRWARLPSDSDADPQMICVYCLRTWRPEIGRQAMPLVGSGAMPPRGRGRPV